MKCPKTEASRRAVPLQTIALEALEDQQSSRQGALVFPTERGGYLDRHNFRNREWKPAQLTAGVEPLRRIYDLRHTFAAFALRAGISTFDLSRYMGASLTMIDRQAPEARARPGHRGHESAANRRDLTPRSDPRVDARGPADVRTTFARVRPRLKRSAGSSDDRDVRQIEPSPVETALSGGDWRRDI